MERPKRYYPQEGNRPRIIEGHWKENKDYIQEMRMARKVEIENPEH